MANTITTQTVTPTTINVENVPHTDVLTASAMVESYLGKSLPVSLVSLTYSIDDTDGVLMALTDYPINIINSITDDQEYTYSPSFIIPSKPWTTNMIAVQYVGGLPTQIYDATVRTATMLRNRSNLAPELTNPEVVGTSWGKYNPMYRSGLASDVKAMLFPFKEYGF